MAQVPVLGVAVFIRTTTIWVLNRAEKKTRSGLSRTLGVAAFIRLTTFFLCKELQTARSVCLHEKRLRENAGDRGIKGAV